VYLLAVWPRTAYEKGIVDTLFVELAILTALWFLYLLYEAGVRRGKKGG